MNSVVLDRDGRGQYEVEGTGMCAVCAQEEVDGVSDGLVS
jgi:hypothetical protein